MTIGRDARIEYDTAGITTEDGILDRFIPGGGWVIPNLVAYQRSKDRILWRSEWPLFEYRTVMPGPGLLEGFLKLTDGKPKEVMEYAFQWGVLHICEHGLPRSHQSSGLNNRPFVLPGRHSEPNDACELLAIPLSEFDETPVELWVMQHYEPLAAWRKYSRMARTVLDLAVELDKGKLGAKDDWRIVNGDFWPPTTVEEGRSQLERVIAGWLAIGYATPYLDWSNPSPEIRLSVTGLFGAIGVQLLMALGRSEGFAVCSACGSLFMPSPKPRTGKRRYCDTCRAIGAPARDASADYRRRRKKKESSNDQAR